MDDPLSFGLYVALFLVFLGDEWLTALQTVYVHLPIGDLLGWQRMQRRRTGTQVDLMAWRRGLTLLLPLLKTVTHGLWMVLWSARLLLWATPWLTMLGVLAMVALTLTAAEGLLTVWVHRHWRVWAARLAPSASVLARVAQALLPQPTKDIPRETLTLSWETFSDLIKAMGTQPPQTPLLRMLYAVLRLNQTLVREIMVPRVDMVALEVHTPLKEALKTFIQTGFSRLPVYEGRIDNIIGILYGKDLLAYCQTENWERVSLRDLVRPAFFVPEAKPADQLLQEMRNRQVHMAVVVDEYGGVAGLVTLEDIMEEIVGEIHDEYDRPVMDIRRISENEFLVSGRMDIDNLNDLLGTQLERNIADTLGGFIFTRLGRVPQEGEAFREGPLLIKVEKVEGHRIQLVRIQKLPNSQANVEEAISHE